MRKASDQILIPDLINTSRGALIDTNAAVDTLKKGKLGYLGIDVYQQEEKLFFHDPDVQFLHSIKNNSFLNDSNGRNKTRV